MCFGGRADKCATSVPNVFSKKEFLKGDPEGSEAPSLLARFPFLLRQVGRGLADLFSALFSLLKINMFFDRFWVAFGCHVGSILGAKIDPS